MPQPDARRRVEGPDHAALRGRGGLARGGWRDPLWSLAGLVADTPGLRGCRWRVSHPTEPRRGADGPQRTVFGMRESVHCGPPLTASVRHRKHYGPPRKSVKERVESFENFPNLPGLIL